MHLADFERALRLGLGRTAVYLRDHDAAPYRAAILHACLNDLSYDDDIEDNRGQYMYRHIQLTGEIEFYRTHILQALAASGDDDAAVQLFELAKHFAQAGDVEARQVMYARFQANSIMGDTIGGRSIIELDKTDGLIAAATAIGGQPRDEDEAWYDDALLRFAERAGVVNPVSVLEQAAVEQPRIRDFLAKVQGYRKQERATRKTRRDPATVSYAELKDWIIEPDTHPMPVVPSAWGQHASDADLVLAAHDLEQEKNPKRLRRYLRIFYKRRFPLDPGRLIEFASDEDPLTSTPALHALKLVYHPQVRALAVRLLATPNQSAARAVALFIENFAPGDHTRVEALASHPLDDEAWHSLGIEINDLFDAHPAPDSEERVLLRLYENDPCSLCRGRIVKRLAALNRLPDWMIEEVRYDADPGMYAELEKYRLELASKKESP